MDLYAGVSKIDITPQMSAFLDGNPRIKKSQGIHDPLYAKALFLDNGESQALFVTLDLIGLYNSCVNEIRELVAKKVDIGVENILISSSHTHSGPSTLGLFSPPEKEWLNNLPFRIVEAVSQAVSESKQVTIGVGTGEEKTIGHQRRLWHRDGYIIMNWEDFSQEEIICPAGPDDFQVGVIEFKDNNNLPYAILINHTCHPNVLAGDNYFITADYPGYAMNFIEKETGAVVLFTNGALGNIDIDPGEMRGFRGMVQKGETLAGIILKILKDIKTETVERLSMKQSLFSIPCREIDPGELGKAKEKIKGFKREKIALVDGATEEIFADELVRLSEMKEKEIKTELQSIVIDNVALLALPGEPFVEIGLAIKERSKFKYTFVIGVANGYVGYIPTEIAFKEGGYTTRPARWSKLVPEAERLIIDKAEKLLEQI